MFIKFLKFTFSYGGRRDPIPNLQPIRKADLILPAFAAAGFLLMILLMLKVRIWMSLGRQRYDFRIHLVFSLPHLFEKLSLWQNGNKN